MKSRGVDGASPKPRGTSKADLAKAGVRPQWAGEDAEATFGPSAALYQMDLGFAVKEPSATAQLQTDETVVLFLPPFAVSLVVIRHRKSIGGR